MDIKLLQTLINDSYDILITKVDFDSQGNTVIQTKNDGIIKIPYIPGTKFTNRLKEKLDACKTFRYNIMLHNHAKAIFYFYHGKPGYDKPGYIIKRFKHVLHIKFGKRIIKLDMREFPDPETIVKRLVEENNISKLMGE